MLCIARQIWVGRPGDHEQRSGVQNSSPVLDDCYVSLHAIDVLAHNYAAKVRFIEPTATQVPLPTQT
jgi:hypothetical protein